MSTNVISAGPSAGKSSTIRELSARGFQTLPEAARILFDQAISEGKEPEQVRQEPDFHEQVESLDRQIEGHINTCTTTFLDRSLADNIAYRQLNPEAEIPSGLIKEVKDRYDTIFILERIEFKDDEVRSEDETQAEEIHQQLIETYMNLGYEPVIVPLKPVDERADFIESKL